MPAGRTAAAPGVWPTAWPTSNERGQATRTDGTLLVQSGIDRVLTVPNALSLIRLLCAPLFLWLLFGPDRPYSAALLLGALGATDWVDGYIARHFNQVSRLGQILDPTADRVLLLVAIIGILVHGTVPVWVALTALLREVLVAGTALVLAALGAQRIEVSWPGKAGTFALMFAFPFFLASDPSVGWHDTARVVAWVWAIPGLALAWYAAVTYVPAARTALAEGRRGKNDAAGRLGSR